MSGLLLGGDPGARSRMASYVVSGVGFLGAGVIFKDSANVRGLNTAATIWCSAAIGVLTGLGAPHLSLVLAGAVLFTNTILRPLAYRLHPVLPEAIPVETQYEVNLTCRSSDEVHLRALLLSTISQFQVVLQAIHSKDRSHKNLCGHAAPAVRISQHRKQIRSVPTLSVGHPVNG